ncbi:hypothetical protein P691DRAFT_768082 [Macrolepiota fuliginosa MF-IS2]|uniref:Uncharacterized protein n=1 Tax=Macrolepiota fuliginosa MF-IS2 TaxID=1400762 RepID=A0A9P5WXP0_9AGAR|nr:hypothetical protein P691DRAFT_768082 [Macrolepiota fuliginosa MF-IS2]
MSSHGGGPMDMTPHMGLPSAHHALLSSIAVQSIPILTNAPWMGQPTSFHSQYQPYAPQAAYMYHPQYPYAPPLLPAFQQQQSTMQQQQQLPQPPQMQQPPQQLFQPTPIPQVSQQTQQAQT